MRRPTRRRFVPLTAAAGAAVTALVVTACGTSASTSANSSVQPITVGISLPLSGQFAADGLATRNGYKLWASDVNTNGGLLHRPVKLVIRNDNSNEKTVTSDYNVLINQDHVNLTLAPFSTLLTSDAQAPTAKHGYALVAGSATGGLVFGPPSFHNFFSVSLPVKLEMASFAKWVTTLPPSQRQTAAYPEVQDPFADPPVDSTEATLHQHGVKTLYWNPEKQAAVSNAQIHEAAVRAAQHHPQIMVIGSVDLPSLLIFIHTFEAMKYTPNIMIAASGPDQGQAFLNKLDPLNAQDIMVPDGWFGGDQNALSHVMVEDYIAKYGGTSADINADVAEAYSAGEVLADAVTATKGVSNAAIIKYLHTPGVTLQTVQGPVRFQSDGENREGQAFIFQWQSNGQFIPVLGPDTGTHGPTTPKPGFQTG
jgi:branched-chain amino acid transport system substrate-binding protein